MSFRHKLNEKFRKCSKNWDTYNNALNCPKIKKIPFFNEVMRPEDADGMANIVDPDQTAPAPVAV